MADRILRFGGIGPLSQTEADKGDAEPDRDPRQRGAEIVRGLHLMSAAEQLEPAATTSMAYFGPDSAARGMGLEEIEQAVRDGDLSLTEEATKTERFTPLVNPRRSRHKRTGDLDSDADADLWHVPTSNYNAMPPRQVFEPLARAIESNDSVSDSGVFGEFRERRNGGEVHGDVWFEDFDVGAIDNDPVRLGFKVRWNYFGDLAFSYQPFAQQTRCKNSVAPLDDWQPVMHHNKSINWRETWDEVIQELGVYGDELSQRIQAARDILFDFTGDQDLLGEDDTGPEIIPMPMSLEGLYRHAGFPDPEISADHAREEARGSDDPRETADRINAWHVHAGATYWLSWHWTGSEGSRAFREYRRTANDLLMNPHQIVDRARDSYEEDERDRIVEEVVGVGASIEDATDEERAEIETRLQDHEGIAQVRNSAEQIGELVERFEDTEERLDRMQEAMAE